MYFYCKEFELYIINWESKINVEFSTFITISNVSVKFQLAKLKKDFNVFKIRKNINNFP